MGQLIPTLAAEHLHVRRGGRSVLHGATCGFPRGVTALIGRNGTGKTTLMRSMIGLLPIDSGSVLFHGAPALTSPTALRDLRSRLGWMPQDLSFPKGLRVSEAVDYAAWLRGSPSRDTAGLRRDALEQTDLADLARRRATDLSGGQARRLGLACALVGDPEVLLLDEPTVGLDPIQRACLLEIVRDLGADRTVVISTHLVEDILATAEHVVALAEGRITHASPLQDLVPKGVDAGHATATVTRLLSGAPPENA